MLKSLISLDHKTNSAFKNRFGDYINIFTCNKVYIGLESRRIAYEIDKANGCNRVEDAIKAGKLAICMFDYTDEIIIVRILFNDERTEFASRTYYFVQHDFNLTTLHCKK